MEDLKLKRFTGYCLVNQGKHTHSLVFRHGNTVLASFHQKHGDEAVREIQSILEEPVDAILSELTPVQIQLAIEFNTYAQVTQPVLPVPRKGRRTADSPPAPPTKPDMHTKPDISRTQSVGQSLPEGKVLQSHSTFGKRTMVLAPLNGNDEKDENGTVIIDLDSLDSMDLDGMAEKIRSSARNTVQHLELGHLLEKGENDA